MKLLANERQRHPQQRLGQLIWNALALDGQWKAPEANQLFYIEDDRLIAALENMENKLKQEQTKSSKRRLKNPNEKLIQETVLHHLPLFQMLATNKEVT